MKNILIKNWWALAGLLCSASFLLSLDSTVPSITVTSRVPHTLAKQDLARMDDMTFEVYTPARKHSKIKCLMLVLNSNKLIDQIAKVLQFDLEFSDQIDVEMKKGNIELNEKVTAKLFEQGTSMCMYLSSHAKKKSNNTLRVLIKDTSSHQALFDKEFTYPAAFSLEQAHRIADELVLTLTGEQGPMLSTLAYCKQLSAKHKVICLADYSCMVEKTVVGTKTINVAPCWHNKAPMLFYSQFTRSNSRLMAYDIKTKKHKIICSYDGLNMQPSFSPDGSKAALCLSGKGNAEIYLYDQAVCSTLKKRVFFPLTNNKGNNVSPCYLPNHNLIFCSDFQTHYPQIYVRDAQTKKVTRLTNGRGYCAAPAYCAKNNALVYTRYIKGTFQLFMLNVHDKEKCERQITFSAGDKLEPTWSECGKYVAFTYNFIDPETKKKECQIASFNLASGKLRLLTSGKEHKSFPSWSAQSLYCV